MIWCISTDASSPFQKPDDLIKRNQIVFSFTAFCVSAQTTFTFFLFLTFNILTLSIAFQYLISVGTQEVTITTFKKQPEWLSSKKD